MTTPEIEVAELTREVRELRALIKALAETFSDSDYEIVRDYCATEVRKILEEVKSDV